MNEELQRAADALRGAVGQVIVGQERVVDEVLICLFAGGHVLPRGRRASERRSSCARSRRPSPSIFRAFNSRRTSCPAT